MSENPLKELLDILLARLHLDTENDVAQMVREWIEIVGPDIAPHSKLYEIRNNILVIETDHPAWSSIILMKKKQILARIATQFPELGVTGLTIKSMK
ncbi:MAG: DUF721 domain-containing protein [Spirochaetia bacterium]|nr:DUF721 domain-containing protein [Spirochaetia bacterium]